jgi:hypothetical protein
MSTWKMYIGKTNENICNKWKNKWHFFNAVQQTFCVWIINYGNGITIGCNNAGKNQIT